MRNFNHSIKFLQDNCDFQVIANTTWSEDKFKEFSHCTGLAIPNDLADILRQYGHCGTECNDSFLVQYDDGSRSVHDVQVLISNFDIIVSRHETFISASVWPDQFTLPMVFFGSADSGHSYLLMDGKNPDNGSVYFWERATDPFGTGNNAKGVVKVADSLPEFFLSLTSAENL